MDLLGPASCDQLLDKRRRVVWHGRAYADRGDLEGDPRCIWHPGISHAAFNSYAVRGDLVGDPRCIWHPGISHATFNSYAVRGDLVGDPRCVQFIFIWHPGREGRLRLQNTHGHNRPQNFQATRENTHNSQRPSLWWRLERMYVCTMHVCTMYICTMYMYAPQMPSLWKRFQACTLPR